MELFLDPSTFVPVCLMYNTHPDNDELRNIPVKIEFSDYQPLTVTQGLVPHHIQKYLQGTLQFDILVDAVSLNPGIPASHFLLQ